MFPFAVFAPLREILYMALFMSALVTPYLMTHDPPLIRAMLEPDFYPHEVSAVDLIQTHISWVLLAGEYAYKVKKPVDFGFLDFTHLARRKHYCEQELNLNRQLSPELYLAVLPICEHEDAFNLGEQGKVIEYCLKMVRFAQQDVLDQRLASGTFKPEWMDELASDVASFHDRAETSATICNFGGIDFLQEHVETIFRVAAQHLGEVISPDELASLESHSSKFLKAHTKAYKQRQKNGFIRACHGDLHLKNITMHKGHPRIFDCIEFNDEFRMIDTMSDAAFLMMDCISRQRPDLAYRFLSRYLEHTGDYEGLNLLPLYLTYRAGVRGKVACLLAADGHLDNEKRQEQLKEAHHYFTLAPTFMLASTFIDKKATGRLDGRKSARQKGGTPFGRPFRAGQSPEGRRPESRVRGMDAPNHMPAPRLFVIGGLSGSGKSHLSLIGAGEIPAVVIRSDATRKRLARIYPELLLYGLEMHAKTYDAMFEAGRTALKAGFSVILDATFLRRQDRDQARDLADEMKTDCHILWLDMDVGTLRQRIRNRGNSDISDADITVLEKQLAEYQRPVEPDVRFLTDSACWPPEHL